MNFLAVINGGFIFTYNEWTFWTIFITAVAFSVKSTVFFHWNILIFNNSVSWRDKFEHDSLGFDYSRQSSPLFIVVLSVSHLSCLACSRSPIWSLHVLSTHDVISCLCLIHLQCPPANLSSLSSLSRSTRVLYLPLRWEEVTVCWSLYNIMAHHHCFSAC